MKNYLNCLLWFLAVGVILTQFGCKSETSRTTGWDYNNPANGGYEVHSYLGQETGPGLVLVEGGTFSMGAVEQDVTFEFHNISRRVTVPSFYMDETEVANKDYGEYVYWTQRVFGADFPEIYRKTLPDTLVWRDVLAYNEPYVQNYFRHPAYMDYPVVGVSWIQATEYCKWRTDRVNEYILIRDGYMALNPNQVGEDNFNSESYLVGQYEPVADKNLRYKRDYDPNGSGERKVRWTDGILLPDYRLPTEAEWEYAALGLIGNNPIHDELVTDRKVYSWNGHLMRNPVHGGWWGEYLANFKRGRGDYMGTAGKLNDNAEISAPVHSFMPNAFGLYNMCGNVSEWVMDVYRPLSAQDKSDLNPFRGNDFMRYEFDEEGYPVEKDTLGRLVTTQVKEEENTNRRNYQKADQKNVHDGDEISEIKYFVSTFDVLSLINDQARVYKGGSWRDLAYFLSPGSRRFLDENQSTADIGFRCCMARVGSPTGNEFKGGNWFEKK